MAALIFLSFFIALGLGVVLVAMRGGPRGVRETLERGRVKRLHAGEFAVVALIVIFGFAVPAVVLLSDQASAGPGGTKLKADVQRGRVLFNQKCATCHTLNDANAVGRVGPNLDVLAPTEGLTLSAIREGRARGTGQMPAQLLDGQDAKDVAAYIAQVAGR
ncbi:MAG: cytochrome [Solirubrobacteraceae bacterium]|jgi:mono/diheme cytochrome c family protein|nr:cytochrome [Solirubrobacteraceae bacterium]MEA2187740.1 cytochrome [Solirubrobacteraceae bacterium]